ncbi:hypothetical protein G7054_g4381 [Neopestalotiopsis clavispora]|nr:hypothetical protein G7054_g4381 [Neopestalotiopsis clavispora]
MKIRSRSNSELAKLILPSFAQDWLHTTRPRPKKTHSTSYLDGIRGLAALAVLGYHFTDYNLKYFHPGYGVEESSSLLQLPYVRLLFAGKPMVHLFFVVSGFALSLRPLQELLAGQTEECYRMLSSSIYRRPIRLLGPCLVLTFSLVFWARAGFFLHYLSYEPTLWAQISHWYSDFFLRIAWPWSWDFGDRPKYNVHLWTIPIELSHSYLLFLVILLITHIRSRFRLATLIAIMVYTLQCGRWAAFEFVGGCLLAYIHIRQEEDSEEEETMRRQSLAKSSWHYLCNFFQVLVFVAGAFVMSWPTDFKQLPETYQFLAAHAPEPFVNNASDFWFALSAFAVVESISHLRILRQCLELPFPQYLGKISFSLYILQHPFLNLIQPYLMGTEPRPAIGNQPAIPGSGLKAWPGVETWRQRVLTWFIGWMIVVLLQIWLADLYTRWIDQPCVRLSKTAERWICVQAADRSPERLGSDEKSLLTDQLRVKSEPRSDSPV